MTDMYLKYFGLEKHPFNITPDPTFLFFGTSHKRAFEATLFGIQHRKGFIEVIGGVGTGKTTLSRAILKELEGKNVATALILNPRLTGLELLKTINEEFGIQGAWQTKKDLLASLNKFLLETAARGGNACLILDECQDLETEALEEVRLLSNLETDTQKLLQIVLMGQLEFHEMLASEDLKALNERIQIRCFLEPFTKGETESYIVHRLSLAGSRGDVGFTTGAVEAIYEFSRGNPRRINLACDRALLLAYARGYRTVDRKIAKLAVGELRWERKGGPRDRRRLVRAALYIPLAALGVGLGIGSGSLLMRWDIKVPLVAKHKGPESSRVQENKIEGEGIQAAVSTASPEFRRLKGFTGLWIPADYPSIEELARRAGWEPVRLVADFGRLLSFQRACILEIRWAREGGMVAKWVILRGVSEAGVWVQQGESEFRFVSKQELEGIWSGVIWVWLPKHVAEQKLRPGYTGPEVAWLQRALIKLGYWRGAPTGTYDWRTTRGVRRLQRELGLEVDGTVGPQTMAMITQLLGEEVES